MTRILESNPVLYFELNMSLPLALRPFDCVALIQHSLPQPGWREREEIFGVKRVPRWSKWPFMLMQIDRPVFLQSRKKRLRLVFLLSFSSTRTYTHQHASHTPHTHAHTHTRTHTHTHTHTHAHTAICTHVLSHTNSPTTHTHSLPLSLVFSHALSHFIKIFFHT